MRAIITILCFVFIANMMAFSNTYQVTPDSDSNTRVGYVWSLVLNLPDSSEVEVVQLPQNLSIPFSFEKSIGSITVKILLTPKDRYTIFNAKVNTQNGETRCFLSLRYNYVNGKPWNFNGEVTKSNIFRQSPHDNEAWFADNIARQGIPMVAIKNDSSFVVAINDSPAFYDNFTTQEFNNETKTLTLSSGDNGKLCLPDNNFHRGYDGKILAYYHNVSESNPHSFNGIIFNCKTTDLRGLRTNVNRYVADYFGKEKYNDYFGALAFTTAYMNLRVNETGRSKYWVVPSVEYANTQYCRDGFWISTMLSPEMDAQCLNHELSVSVNDEIGGGDYPLFVVIWAYRNKMKGIDVDMKQVQYFVDGIERHAKDGFYYSYNEPDKNQNAQYWADCIAFEKNDPIAFNQGLFALLLVCAEKMNLKIKTKPGLALKKYQEMFNSKKGFFQVSTLKNSMLSPDPVVPDLLAQMLINRPLLDKNQVMQHFQKISTISKTKYGYKSFCTLNGSYLPYKAFDAGNYLSELHKVKISQGSYQNGGSWMLYDMLFLLDAYLHGIKGAKQELLWRATLDFKIGGTTFECIDTKTGGPWKPNMGWNVAIYSFIKSCVDQGKMNNELFDAIDKVCPRD